MLTSTGTGSGVIFPRRILSVPLAVDIGQSSSRSGAGLFVWCRAALLLSMHSCIHLGAHFHEQKVGFMATSEQCNSFEALFKVHSPVRFVRNISAQ